MMLLNLANLFITILTACAFATPAALDLVNVPTSELIDDFFNGAVSTSVPVVAAGPIITPDGEFDDSTNASLAGIADEPQQELRITMGTHLQHVGFIELRNLGADLQEILELVCYGPSLHLPNPRSRRKDIYWIKNIAWTRNNDGVLKVQVESSDYSTHNEGSDLDLLGLFIDQIIKTFGAAISCDKNRYQMTWARCHEWANSADWYQVGIHGLEGGIFPHMRVRITFRDRLEEGQFDCKGTETSVWNTLSNDRVQGFARVMGYPLRTAVLCADKSGIVEG